MSAPLPFDDDAFATDRDDPDDPAGRPALLALPSAYARPPDMPIEIAMREADSLTRMARVRARCFARIGVHRDAFDRVDAFAGALKRYETRWRHARRGAPLGLADRGILHEAEALAATLVAAARWCSRDEPATRQRLDAITHGGSVAEIVDALQLVGSIAGNQLDRFQAARIDTADLLHAQQLVTLLRPAVATAERDAFSTRAYALRNRAFWAAHDACDELREAGRYLFHAQPKIAWKFRSRFRPPTGPGAR